ncbi:hypothetical protein L1049_025530 [Liquidambar formosana]|uniref:Uncharacterized protein n=1 Tax=Liquidambar formosana TaxID=63359 RepID=A0AAP0NB27_LIQFO
MPQPCEEAVNELIFNIDDAPPDINVKDGLVTTLTASQIPLLEEIGLSANLVKLDANVLCSLMYTADSAVPSNVCCLSWIRKRRLVNWWWCQDTLLLLQLQMVKDWSVSLS